MLKVKDKNGNIIEIYYNGQNAYGMHLFSAMCRKSPTGGEYRTPYCSDGTQGHAKKSAKEFYAENYYA